MLNMLESIKKNITPKTNNELILEADALIELETDAIEDLLGIAIEADIGESDIDPDLGEDTDEDFSVEDIIAEDESDIDPDLGEDTDEDFSDLINALESVLGDIRDVGDENIENDDPDDMSDSDSLLSEYTDAILDEDDDDEDLLGDL